MSLGLAVVDDSDSAVVYSGAWPTFGSGEEFQATTHCSTEVGSTATFEFTGTQVDVYGTMAANSTTASLSFAVDQGTSVSFAEPSGTTSDVHHQLFYSSGPLSNSKHTLLITQAAVAPSSNTNCSLYLDFVTYNATTTGAEAYFVDDRDPGIQYSPAWVQMGSEQDFMHTSQMTPGAGATMTFQFNGEL
ncbi:hypothetical protein HMN09_00355800 [Mycena chlorophos]|uniref:Uncharacterized protein n=1 Tax=Mycena chlorophos TaxID=658473 RepID=A0A8H6WIS7_MYCCL|nr:hypothetical protein HMN09_00355800 [Mycena chlorophos]